MKLERLNFEGEFLVWHEFDKSEMLTRQKKGIWGRNFLKRISNFSIPKRNFSTGTDLINTRKFEGVEIYKDLINTRIPTMSLKGKVRPEKENLWKAKIRITGNFQSDNEKEISQIDI